MMKREDPHYEMFRQYLIQRIQKNYQNFDTNNNDTMDTTALNLKAGAMDFTSQSNVFTNPVDANTFLTSPIMETQAAESQSSRNMNDNNYKPMILQKMLQAPLGTNLGAMARLEANQILPMEHYQSLRIVDDNNSDTITADSESADEEWNEREYYNIFDNRRSQTVFSEQTQIPQFNLDQMMNYLQNNGQNGYQMNNQMNFALSNVQENCQAWIDNSIDYRGPIDYTETNDSSRIYPSYSVDDHTNYQFQNDGNVTNFGQSSHAMENSSLQIQSVHSYYQMPNQHVQPFRSEFYDQNHSSTVTNNSTFNTNVSHPFNPVNTQDSFAIYSQENSTSAPYSVGENFQYSMYQNQCTNQSAPFSVTSTFTQANGEQNVQLKTGPDNNSQRDGNGELHFFCGNYFLNFKYLRS